MLILLYLTLAYIVGMLHFTSKRGLTLELWGAIVGTIYIIVVASCIALFILTARIVEQHRYRQVIKKINARPYRVYQKYHIEDNEE